MPAAVQRWPSPRTALTLLILGFAVWQAACIVLSSNLAIEHDEVNFLIESMRLPAEGRLTAYLHGTFVYELLAVMEVIWYTVSWLLGSARTPVDHLANVLAAMGPHLKAGRMLALAAGVLSLVQIFRIGRHFAGEWAGVLAALLCASSLTFAVFTTVIKEDAFLWLFLLTAMDLMWRSSPAENRRPFLAGVAVGAAFATKYFAIFWMVLAVLPLARALRGGRSRALGQGAVMAAGAAVGVLVLFPFLIFDLRQVLLTIRSMSEVSASVAPEFAFAIESYLLVHLPRLVGPVVGVAALIELIVRLMKEPRGPILLFVPSFLLLCFLGSRRGYSIGYYLVPVACAGFVLASAFAARVSARLDAKGRAVPFLVLCAVAAFDPAYLSSTAKYGLLLTGPDTRALAAAVIESSVPAGECVVATGGVAGWNQFGPALVPLEVRSVSASGRFTAAQRAALARQPGPHFRLHLVDGFTLPAQVPAECQWMVEARLGTLSMLELAPLKFTQRQLPQSPAGFAPVAEVRAFPEVHTFTYPFMTVMDLDELRSVSLGRMWRDRRMGPSFVIYRKTP